MTRINPLHNLKQTARDLAELIVFGEQTEVMGYLQEAKAIYQQPLNSWTTGLVYRLLRSRQRFDEIDQVIKDIFNVCDEDDNQSDFVIDLFEKGGWEETSFNTTLIRVMTRHLHNYDSSILLPLQVVTELKALLIYEQARLLNQDQISKQQTVIVALKTKKIEMHNKLSELARQLIECESRLTAIKSDEQSALAQERERRQQELDKYQAEMKKLDEERQSQEKRMAEIKLLSIKPTLDLNKLTDAQLKEIQHQVQVTVDLFFKDLEEKSVKSRELTNVTKSGIASQARSQFNNLSLFNQDTVRKQAEDRHAEVAATAGRSSGTNTEFKAKLAKLMGERAAPQQMKPLRRKEQNVEVKFDPEKLLLIPDYQPALAATMVANAMTEVNNALAITAEISSANRMIVQPEEIERVERFSSAKKSMATLFTPRAPSQRVEANKLVPQMSTMQNA